MVHIVLKSYKQTRMREMAGEVIRSPTEIRHTNIEGDLLIYPPTERIPEGKSSFLIFIAIHK
jgi:hypothetical protein